MKKLERHYVGIKFTKELLLKISTGKDVIMRPSGNINWSATIEKMLRERLKMKQLNREKIRKLEDEIKCLKA